MRRVFWLAALIAPLAVGQDFQAGVARVKITPAPPVWLAGFGARTTPAQSVWTDLWAKALAFQDAQGGRAVILTMDLVAISREISDEVAARLERSHHLRRSQVVLNASHTHSGPGVWPRLAIYREGSAADQEKVRLYGRFLMDQLTAVAVKALDSMEPAMIYSRWTEVGFAMNRRTEQLASIRPGEQFPAPVDHRVPVLDVRHRDGRLLAVLFGYACHNTTMTGDTNEVNADYAGAAQTALEKRFPGLTALFLELCGGDQRVMPRGTRERTLQHGQELADVVAQQLMQRGDFIPLRGAIRTSYQQGTLPFLVHQHDVYQAEAASSDRFAARRGRRMLTAIKEGKPILSTPYPAQAIALGPGFVLLALGGEVVVDYALRFRQEYPNANLVVAGYSNDVPGYIPSLRVWREGGYESGDAMMYFQQPGWFTDQVEERVADLAHRALAEAGFPR